MSNQTAKPQSWPWLMALLALMTAAEASSAAIQGVTGFQPEGREDFAFTNIAAPSRNDAATTAKFYIVDGEADPNSGGLDRLHDGKLPSEADEPGENFFFQAGTAGGRILVDLERVVEIKQINTFSWHPTTRGPQVYDLWASDGTAKDFNRRPAKDEEAKAGWTLLAPVDTRARGGGQHGVSVLNPDGIVGRYRYLLFDIARTETDDAFGNTFYSEIDVVELNVPAEPVVTAPRTPPFALKSADELCDITIDTARAPELREWAERKLAPVLAAWYPKIAALLASDGFVPPRRFSVVIRPGEGVAMTGGTGITANSAWLKQELSGEALGSLVHEVVHVVQQYGGRRRFNPEAARPPGWLVEGIPDYIRWFLFEPESHGADLVWMRSRRNLSLRYDAGYRVSANFLQYVVEHHDPRKELITKLNAACRQGKPTEPLWEAITGKPLPELAQEWKAAVEKQLAPAAAPGS